MAKCKFCGQGVRTAPVFHPAAGSSGNSRGRVLQRPLALHARLSALDGRRVRRQYLPAEYPRTARQAADVRKGAADNEGE